MDKVVSVRASVRSSVIIEMCPAKKLLNEVAELRGRVKALPSGTMRLLGDLPEMKHFDEDEEVRNVMMRDPVDPAMLWATNEAVLNLVYGEYWTLIDSGDIVPGTNEA